MNQLSVASRATLDSVAALAGVSRATAGRVLAGTGRVSPDRAAAVREAAHQLGYMTNRAARSLVTGRSDSIAVVVSESAHRVFSDPFFAEVLSGAQASALERDVQLVLVVASSAADREQFLRYAVGSNLDGVILVSLHGNDQLPHQLREAGLNVILSGRPFQQHPDLPRVDADNVLGGRLAARALLDRGCTRPATINGPLDMPAARDRLRGWVLELTAAGRLPNPAITADFTQESGYTAMQHLLRRNNPPDGLFAANDQIAFGALRAMAERGLTCPQDIAVVGFDDSPPAAQSAPTLTSIRQPVRQLGHEMVAMAVAISRGEPTPEVILLETTLVRRASCP